MAEAATSAWWSSSSSPCTRAGTQALVAEHTFGAEHAAAPLRGWRDLAASAPRQATFTASARDGRAAVGFVWVGVCVNMLSDEGAEGLHRAYPADKLARLAAVKDAYDRGNAFHLNQNIPPRRPGY